MLKPKLRARVRNVRGECYSFSIYNVPSYFFGGGIKPRDSSIPSGTLPWVYVPSSRVFWDRDSPWISAIIELTIQLLVALNS